MAFKTYLPVAFEHEHENQMFDELKTCLEPKLQSKPSILVGNVILGPVEVDALLVYPGCITLIEMKAYKGSIVSSNLENGIWAANGNPIRAGRYPNPFRQVRAYKFETITWLNTRIKSKIDPTIPYDFGHVSGTVLFRGPIECKVGVDRAFTKWFNITDLQNCQKDLLNRFSPMLPSNDTFINAIPEALGLTVTTGLMNVVTDIGSNPRELDVKFHRKTEFRDSVADLITQGGLFQRAADSILSMCRSKIIPAEWKIYSDDRIENSYIYIINPQIHLLTVQTDTARYLLQVGSKEAISVWINDHRGLNIAMTDTSGKIDVTYINPAKDMQDMPESVSVATSPMKYFDHFEGMDLEKLIENKLLHKMIKEVSDETDSDTLRVILDEIIDIEVRGLFSDLIFMMRKNDVGAAKTRWNLFRGDACPVQDAPGFEEQASRDIVNVDVLVDLSSMSEHDQKKLFDPQYFRDWMLFLHPDQKRIVMMDEERPLVLTGISGSGKTCILVHRARRLVQEDINARVGIITLNCTLALLIKNLVKLLCSPEECKRIEVLAFYEYFQRLLRKVGAEDYFKAYRSEYADMFRLYKDEHPLSKVLNRVDYYAFANEYDPYSSETLDDTWTESMEQEHAYRVLRRVRDYLWNYVGDADSYVRDEISLIRSALLVGDRAVKRGESTKEDQQGRSTISGPANRQSAYLAFRRDGRGIRLSAEIRKDILELCQYYEEYMFAGHLTDQLGLTQALITCGTKQISDLPAEYRYDHLLIDEFQDFAGLDLRLLRAVPIAPVNGLFLAGDTVQKIHVKHLKLSAVALDKGSARHVNLQKNFRNSRQILMAAHSLIEAYAAKAEELGENIEHLNPEFAQRTTSLPIAVPASSKLEEVKIAQQRAQEWMENCGGGAYSVCIATAAPGYISTDYIISNIPETIKADVLTGDYLEHPDRIVVGDINDVKGHEFSMIIIVGLSSASFPGGATPEDEWWRDAFRLYVAMTRGRDQVILTYTQNPSPMLKSMSRFLKWEVDSLADIGEEWIMRLWQWADAYNVPDLRTYGLSGANGVGLPRRREELLNMSVLNLSGMNLDKLPPELCNLQFLTELCIRDNKILGFPASIGDLGNLAVLDARNNQITSLPRTIKKLDKLRELYLSSNKLTVLPDHLAGLSNLEKLEIKNNEFRSLPHVVETLENMGRSVIR